MKCFVCGQNHFFLGQIYFVSAEGLGSGAMVVRSRIGIQKQTHAQAGTSQYLGCFLKT